MQHDLPWPPNRLSYLETTTFSSCKQNPYFPIRQITIAGSPENPSQRFMEELQKNPATHWNITALNAASVISIFKSIVNDRETFKDRVKFTFNIKGDEETISFTLEANPTDKQPGNGFIRRRNPNGGEDIRRNYDKEFIEALTQRYGCTKKFVKTSSGSSRTTQSFSNAEMKSSKMSTFFCYWRLGDD